MPRLSEVPVTEIGRIAAEIERDGIGVLDDFLDPDELQALQAFAEATAGQAGGEYIALKTGEMEASLLGALGNSPAFLQLMRRVCAEGCGESVLDGQTLVQTLRCLKGQSGLTHSLRFHYDSYLLTVLLPIVIPDQGAQGHLIIAPRRRAVRESYLRNMWDKVLLDNPLTQRALKRAHRLGASSLREVQLEPGNLYFFWGYRTVHANAACDPENLRATALFHYGDPYAASPLRRFSRGVRWLSAR